MLPSFRQGTTSQALACCFRTLWSAQEWSSAQDSMQEVLERWFQTGLQVDISPHVEREDCGALWIILDLSAQRQGVAVAMGCSSSVSEAEVEPPSEPVPKRKGLKKSLGPFAHSQSC